MNAANVSVQFFFSFTDPHCFLVGVASEVNEAIGVSSECFEKNGTPTQTTGSFSNSLKQQGVNVSSSNEQGLSKASIVESVSTVLTHLNDRVEPVDMKNMQIHEGGIDPKLCLVPCSPMHLNAQRNYFSPHWSVEAVEKELEVSNVLISHTPENTYFDNITFLHGLVHTGFVNIWLISFNLQKGDVYKAVFHVNAHNKLEVLDIYMIVIFVLGIFVVRDWLTYDTACNLLAVVMY